MPVSTTAAMEYTMDESKRILIIEKNKKKAEEEEGLIKAPDETEALS